MNRHRLIFLSVVFIATMVRVLALLYRPGELETDPDGYVAHAQMIAQGAGFANPHSGLPTAFRPPGLPYLIAWMPGFSVAPGRAVAVLQLTIGVLTVLLTRQLAEQLRLSQQLGNAAALLIALDPLLVRYTILPMTEVLSAALSAGICLASLRYHQFLSSAENSREKVLSGFLCGALIGVASLVRPVFLVCGLLLLSWHVLTAVRTSADAFRKDTTRRRIPTLLRSAFGTGLLLGTSILLPVTPWIIRNAIIFDSLIPSTTHGGYTLALGNNVSYYRDVTLRDPGSPWNGTALLEWQKSMIGKAAEDGIAQTNEVAFDRFMYQQAFETIRLNPATFVKACLHRQLRFWGLTTAIPGRGLMLTISRGTAAWYAVTWIGVGLSVLLFWRHSVPGRACLWLVLSGFLVMHTFYWTDTRMRAPVMPILSVLSLIGLNSLRPANIPVTQTHDKEADR
ncbi:MAG: phospholipid carrier-dependent glycosyltransferase [Planctomyces sp.]|nr:phospholipid carrier-dependent glycosyltransferase [Planctomyces sp.]